MFRDVTAVLFDLDGTLIDTVDLILRAHDHTLRRFLDGWCPPRSRIVSNLGRPLRAALGEYAAERGVTELEPLVDQMVRTYRAFQAEHLAHEVQAYEGVRETLAALDRRGFMLGVVTSKVEETARVSLDRLSLSGFFRVAVFLGDTSRHKPEPDPLLEAARRGCFEPGRGLYVGDSVHDIAAGRAAGMKTAGALWGPFERADLEAARPDVLIEHPTDLLSLLPDRTGCRHADEAQCRCSLG